MTSKDRWPHLLAVAFGELMTNHLDDGKVGSHHGIAPHVTMQVTLDQLHAGLGADLTIPGNDEPTPLSTAAAQRILCDADLTHVIVRRPTAPTALSVDPTADQTLDAHHASPVDEPAATGFRCGVDGARDQAIDHSPADPTIDAHDGPALDAPHGSTDRGVVDAHDISTDASPAISTHGATDCARDERQSLADRLTDAAVEVLYVGRTRRTVTPRQRRALEARDRHCILPGCRAHPRRCHAHHVQEWEDDGPTDISNLALLCVRHHISVHEGGWQITRTPGVGAHETGCWTLSPPRTQP